jgi:hypothetical protein
MWSETGKYLFRQVSLHAQNDMHMLSQHRTGYLTNIGRSIVTFFFSKINHVTIKWNAISVKSFFFLFVERDSILGKVTRLQDGQQKNCCSIPGRGKIISLIQSVHTGSGTHLASYWIRIGGPFPRGRIGRDVKLTSHLHIMPNLRMSEIIRGASVHSHVCFIRIYRLSHCSCPWA